VGYVLVVPPVSTFRVRWFREIALSPAPGANPADEARRATEGNPARAVTVETDGGKGPVLVIALGGGEIHLTGHLNEPYDSTALVVRTWEVEDAAEEIGAADAPDLLLGEFRQALRDDGVTGIRLLVAEENTPDGAPVIVAASWFDSDDYQDDDWLEDEE
jgi:hypothetical protein